MCMCMCTRTYTYAYTYTYTLTPALARESKRPVLIQTSMYLMSVWKVGRFDSCLLGVSARTDINNPKEDALEDLMYRSRR